MTEIVAQLSGLNPFRFNQEEDEDDKGDEITQDSILGGGQVAHKSQLRVSRAIRSFLVQHKILSEHDAGVKTDDDDNTCNNGMMSPALCAMLERDHVQIPPALLDKSHPLSEYFISSSHNTYLVAHQLYGESSVAAYETAMRTGSRCVEIDAWDNAENEDEPKVTHGYTLVSNVLFRAVCEKIRYVFDEEDSWRQSSSPPLLISLENHCGPRGQLRLVQIMKEVFGHRLLTESSSSSSSHDHVFTLEELSGKIVVIVEFHFPDEASAGGQGGSRNQTRDRGYKYENGDGDDDGDDSDSDSDSSNVIIAELAALGVCAQSVKPRDNTWFEHGRPRGGPQRQNHLINVSESGLAALLPAKGDAIVRHNARSLMRVYPKGTRITSSNLQAVPFWGVGAQICALNWQTFGTSNQLNRALFDGSDGFVLKPPGLRMRNGSTGSGSRSRRIKRRRLILSVAGATDVPIAEERDEDDKIKPYLTCTLHTPLDYDEQGRYRKPLKRKTDYYRQHRFGFLHRGENPPVKDPMWDEMLEWEYDEYEEEEDNGLTFLRMLIKSDDSWAPNPRLVVAAVRLEYVLPGWRFIRMMDLRGRETGCTLLVRFDFEDV